MRNKKLYRDRLKRPFDALVVIGSAPIWAPLALGTALVVRRRLGSPVLFHQQRPGRHGRPFHMLKFRTMMERRDQRGELLPDTDRLTPFGSWLRSTSLDELPSLLNVLRGDMSLVGPRPLLMQYLSRYTPAQARRHEVRPGVTGWAQVHGRNAVTWEEKFEMDVWYVDRVSLALDLRILLTTALRVFQRRGVTAAGHATAPEFMGSDRHGA